MYFIINSYILYAWCDMFSKIVEETRHPAILPQPPLAPLSNWKRKKKSNIISEIACQYSCAQQFILIMKAKHSSNYSKEIFESGACKNFWHSQDIIRAHFIIGFMSRWYLLLHVSIGHLQHSCIWRGRWIIILIFWFFFFYLN